MDNLDLYEILQVSSTAEAEVIDAAYVQLTQKYHPDRIGEAASMQRMLLVDRAHHVLRHPTRRADYDRKRPAGSRTDSTPPSYRRWLAAQQLPDEVSPQSAPPYGAADGPPSDRCPPNSSSSESGRQVQEAPGPAPSEPVHPNSHSQPYHQYYAYPQAPQGPVKPRSDPLGGCLKVVGAATLISAFLLVRACFYFADDPKPVASVSRAPPAARVWSNPSEVCVTNTQGEGVYLRSHPYSSAKTGSAYPDGTEFSVDDVRECDPGSTDSDAFCSVEARDGSSGYLPARYVGRCW